MRSDLEHHFGLKLVLRELERLLRSQGAQSGFGLPIQVLERV